MDFKQLAVQLANPWWSQHPSLFLTPHPKELDQFCGPGKWFDNSPTDRAAWNLTWGSTSGMVEPKDTTFARSTLFMVQLRAVSHLTGQRVKLQGAYFDLIELSNLMSLPEFLAFMHTNRPMSEPLEQLYWQLTSRQQRLAKA